MNRLLLERVAQVVSEGLHERAEDKDRINQVVAKIVVLSKVGRREGLLALEEAANVILEDNSFENSLLKQIVTYIVDGTDPTLIENIMTIKFMFNEYDAVESLIYYIIANSSLMIQDEEDTTYIQESIKACIPISFIDENFDIKIEKLVIEQMNKLVD